MNGPTGEAPAFVWLVWMDGRVLPESEARVPVTDRGLLYGDGLFETLRTRGPRAFRLEEHLAKLGRTADSLGIEVPEVRAAIGSLLALRRTGDGALRIILTRGGGPPGLRPPAGHEPRLVVTLGEAPSFEVEQPLEARVVEVRVPRSPLGGHKTLCYLPGVVALGQAGGQDEAIMLDERGRVAQCSASNLCWVTAKGELRTPSTACGIREGVTRHAVMELAAADGIRVAEGEWPSAELDEAREVFATSSLRGVAPIGRLDGRDVGDGGVGPVTRVLMDAYRRLFDSETA